MMSPYFATGTGDAVRHKTAPPPQNTTLSPTPLDYRAIADRLYRERRARAHCFSQSQALFGEPGWDILLELYVAGDAQQAVYVGNACIAADVAQTTGLRWVGKLERLGLLERDSDPSDGRRGLVALTARGRSEMEAYLRRVSLCGQTQPGLRNR